MKALRILRRFAKELEHEIDTKYAVRSLIDQLDEIEEAIAELEHIVADLKDK